MLLPDPKNHPPTAQTGQPSSVEQQGRLRPKQGQAQEGEITWEQMWTTRAQDAYRSSTSYAETNYRKSWDDSIRAFNNQHATDSKYSHEAYAKRSRVYRPKTRSVMRKNEAAAAAAFFSNMDVVSVSPQDPNSKVELASADVMKQLLQYRLTKSIPWFQTVLGGLQDAQVMGAVCAHTYWDYEAAEQPPEIEPAEDEPAPQDEEYPAQSSAMLPANAMVATDANSVQDVSAMEQPVAEAMPMEAAPPPVTDKPVIELVPIENMRVHPGADWIDPVNSSPYVIHLIPMYAQDVKARMDAGEWYHYSDAMIFSATEQTTNTTRLARNKDRDDPKGPDVETVEDYAIVWVQRHIHKYKGEDWDFYMLGDQQLLTDPVPLSETVLHGKRPYVIGCCIIEAHKLFSTSIPMLSRGLQEETNEIANQRLDNVKFVLNKKFFAKRGTQVDVAGLIRNVPGGVVMMDDPEKDVREINWPDVTASAYQEQQSIDMAMDELLGNFNPAAIMANGAMNAPARNMSMLSQSNGTLVEYLIRTYTETLVQPVLRQLVMLEQCYETDEVILAIAGKMAKLFQKYGIDEVTDRMLERELTLTVNVGMGATDPMQKLNKFMAGVGFYGQLAQKPPPGMNMTEVGREIFGHLGYQNGERFFNEGEDPQVAIMKQQMQQVMQMVQQLQRKLETKEIEGKVKLQVAAMDNETDLKKTVIQEQNENKRAVATHFRALTERDADTRVKVHAINSKPKPKAAA